MKRWPLEALFAGSGGVAFPRMTALVGAGGKTTLMYALARRMAEKHTQLRLCPRAAAVIPGTPAGPDDFDTEFLDYILAVRVVGSLEEAVAHIAAKNGVPFVILRAMSDNADENAYETLVVKNFDVSEYCRTAAKISAALIAAL